MVTTQRSVDNLDFLGGVLDGSRFNWKSENWEVFWIQDIGVTDELTAGGESRRLSHVRVQRLGSHFPSRDSMNFFTS